MKHFIRSIFITIAALVAIAGCTRIETGHVGVRYGFDGQVQSNELQVGWHQNVVGHIREYVANEITWELKDLHPQTKDRSALSDLDLAYTYSVAPTAIADLVVKYKGRDAVMNGTYYPLGMYVQNVMTTATTDVMSRYDALTANENREKIRDEIRIQAARILQEEKLDTTVIIHQVFIKNLAIDAALQASARAVITSQNELRAKDFEVQTAKKEAERLTLLASNKGSIDYMNAKSMEAIADGVKSGKVHTIVVPYDFKGIINVK